MAVALHQVRGIGDRENISTTRYPIGPYRSIALRSGGRGNKKRAAAQIFSRRRHQPSHR